MWWVDLAAAALDLVVVSACAYVFVYRESVLTSWWRRLQLVGISIFFVAYLEIHVRALF